MYNRINPEVKAKFIYYLDSHRESIKYARKGYLDKLKTDFETEIGTEDAITIPQMKRLISMFRLSRSCPIEYVPNYHYRPGVRTGFHNYHQKTEETPETNSEETS